VAARDLGLAARATCMYAPGMRRVARHVSYANVVATLALFIALGGTSYAALNLPDGSVGSRQLKPSAVTPSKLGFSIGARAASFPMTSVAAFFCHDNTKVGSRQCELQAPRVLGTMTIKLAHPAWVLMLGRASAIASQDGQLAQLSAYADDAYAGTVDDAPTAIPQAYPPELAVQKMVKLSAGSHKLHLAVAIDGSGTTEVELPRLMVVVLPPTS